jgi:hypothetical protein
MARARARKKRRLREIAEVIVAEWYRVLPDQSDIDQTIKPMDKNSLTAALNNILDPNSLERHGGQAEAVLDQENYPLKVVVPLPPHGVGTKQQLDGYLEQNGDFFEGMGAASLFGCGR